MTDIQQNRYDQLLRRVCDMQGPGSKVSWGLGDLMPVLEVENVPAELELLMGSRVAAGSDSQAGATFNGVILRNPGDSGMIARLIGVYVTNTGANGAFRYGLTQNAGTAGGDRDFWDGRVFGQGTALVTEGIVSAVVHPTNIIRGAHHNATQAFDSWEDHRGIAVLAPGSGFIASGFAIGEGLIATFRWIERPAQPSELNL